MNKPDCTKCGANEWTPIPDSLAQFCKCGKVIIWDGEPNTCREGASLQEWAKDLYEAKQDLPCRPDGGRDGSGYMM